MGKRIVIMAGGTGGHVFPALAVASCLRKQGWQVSWMGTQKGLESRVVPEHKIDIDWLTVAGLRGKGMLANLKAPFMLVLACIQAYKILRSRQPDVVLGMGGFVAGPGGVMAKVLKIPLIVHEQNRIPGTTNRILARFADVVLEAFPDSFENRTQAICTGNPLRKGFSELEGIKAEKQGSSLHLLVVGGSQGAKILNEIVPEAATGISAVEIMHQTGNSMQRQVSEHYNRLGLKANVVAFIEDMVASYQWADMVICRSGAMTVSELAAAGLPSILVPYPYAIDDHQTANARYLCDANAGFIIDQDQLTVEFLAEKIKSVCDNLQAMSSAAQGCARLDATAKVADICIARAG